jgi:hemolysin activation/secretion protein
VPRSTARGATRLSALVCACSAVAYVASATAQVPPDAGRIQEQLRVPEPPRKPVAPQIRIQPPTAEVKADTPPFFVASFRVRGATVFSEEELLRMLGAPSRAMTLQEVQALVERLTNLYRQHGYIVARALIPPQDVRDGIVEVRVVEGRYERIDISNASEISEARIRASLGGVREDAVVHGPTLERAVLLLSELAGIQPKATLEPGAQAGYTNLLLEIAPTRATEFDAALDNGGSRFTGRYRLSAGAVLNSPLKIGDRASVRVITSGDRLLSLRLGYETPLGSSGLRGNAYASETRYELGEEFTALDASGSARSIGAALFYPVLRSSDLNLRVQGGGEAREFEDRIGSLEIVNEKSVRVLQLGGSGDFRDPLLGGGITAFQALATAGRLSLRTPLLAETNAATARTQGTFYKLLLSAQRLQRITEALRLVLSYAAQLAADNLDSSEKFSVGGPTGVRAYPSGEAAGDDVHFAQAELRYSAGSWLGGQLTPLVFLEHARSRINHRTWDGFTGTNVRSLSGAGIGAEWTMSAQVFVRGWYAHKLGEEAATADTDKDSRVWLQAGVLF